MHKDDLAASLAALSGLLTANRDLDQTLVQVAQLAVTAIPGADGAGLTLLDCDAPPTVIATAAFVTSVDEVQYSLMEGPSISAVEQAHSFSSGNLGGDPRWPHFGPQTGRLGVHSAMSLPLVLPQQVIGALHVYAFAKHAFDATAMTLAEAFAGPAAVSVANAQSLDHAERRSEQLAQALAGRGVIDQAMGVMMSRTGGTADDAFDRLRIQSQLRSVKLGEVARELLGDAVRRARARHSAESVNKL
jgi:GAF domain-containing protein